MTGVQKCALPIYTARSLGMPLSWARWGLVLVMSVATGTAVAQMGLIAFIGLAAPHAIRSSLRCTHAALLLLSALIGVARSIIGSASASSTAVTSCAVAS